MKLCECHTVTLPKKFCLPVPAMASSSRPQKLAKLQHFKASLPFHSQSSLHAMIEEAKEVGLPEFSTPKHQREARRQTIAECHGGDLGPLIQETFFQDNDGEPTPFVFTSLLTYLVALFARGGSWAQLLSTVHAQCPSSPSKPWRLVHYWAEPHVIVLKSSGCQTLKHGWHTLPPLPSASSIMPVFEIISCNQMV